MAALDLKAFTRLKWFYQIAIVAGVFGALVGGFWYTYLAPMTTQITEKQDQLTKLQQEVAKSLQQKKMFEQFKADTIELGQKLEALKAVLPLENETDQIIRSLRSEAEATAVKINRINLRPQ